MKYAILFVAIMTMAFQCEENIEGCESDEWISQQISNAEQNQNTRIERYRYKERIVFKMDTCVGCADAMQVVYDCNGNTLCQFGGIAGFNTCPDFETEATLLDVIYPRD